MDSKPPLASSSESRLTTILKVVAVFAFLYIFLLGIGGMGTAFKAMGKSAATDLKETE